MLYRHNGVVIREARAEDIQALKDRLREADVKEVIAAGSQDAEQALGFSFARSALRYSVELEDGDRRTVVAMFGVVPDPGGTICGGAASGNVWFLGADEMSRIKKTFVRMSRHMIAKFLSNYPVLWNYVDMRYSSSILWLKSCGADFGPTFQISGIDFIPFVIRRA